MIEGMDMLARAIKARQAILFAGAGVSMSVGLPGWATLIEHLREEMNLEGVADGRLPHPLLAEYYRLQMGSIGPLRSWMDRAWNISPDLIRNSQIHQTIVDLDFPIIYTTNYDNNLEIAHALRDKKFVKIVGVRDLTKHCEATCQIVKFHGDFSDDKSLVITETDYLDRLDFNSPLDLKFRSDALGRPLLFIGYSLSDMNIRLLLHRLWRTWHDAGREQERPGVYLFSPQPDPVRDAVLAQWGITALSEPADDPAMSLERFLARLQAKVASL